MVGQRKDWVRCVASLSRGVRGGGRMGFGMECWGGDGRAAVRAEMSGLMEVLGKIWPLIMTSCGLMWIVDESGSLREKPAALVSQGIRPSVIWRHQYHVLSDGVLYSPSGLQLSPPPLIRVC